MAIGRPLNANGPLGTRTLGFNATASQTEFVIPGGYTINNIDVFRNGVKLTTQSDYQATDEVKIILVDPAQLNDEITCKVFESFSVDNAIVGSASSQTINGDLVVTGTLYQGGADTSVGAAGTWTNFDGLVGVTTSKKVRIQNDLQVTGVGTFGSLVSSGTISGVDGNFSGNVTIGGTLIKEDVTNIDSVGLVTARSGVRIPAGGLSVVGVSTFDGNIQGIPGANILGIHSVTADELFADTSEAVSGRWILGADGTNNYTFTGPGLIGAENDPTLYLQRGMVYQFTNGLGAHPFRIQSDVNGATGTQYNDGITNNDVTNGTLTWKVQMDAPNTLYYQCTAHPNMGGVINIGGGGGGGDTSTTTHLIWLMGGA